MRFAELPETFCRPRVNWRTLRDEIKQIGATLILDESGEDRIRPDGLPPADLSPIEGALYVISDVHLGGKKEGGIEPWKYRQLRRFLRNVARGGGNLVINGDFLELFINHAFLYEHLQPVYRDLRRIKRVIYIPGNHDDRLKGLVGKRWKNISFLDSVSIPINGKVVHIEHGHLADWWWHHKSEQGGEVIMWVNRMGERGINVPLWYEFFQNWFFFFFPPIQIVQLFLLDKRVRQLRREMADRMGFSETMRPFLSRLWNPFALKRLVWELFARKEERTLNCVFGHFHDPELWLFGTLLFRLINNFRTRVKLHFTAGGWLKHFFRRKRLFYTRIDPSGRIERLELEKLIKAPDVPPPPPRIKPPSRRLDFSPEHRFPHLFREPLILVDAAV